MDITRHVIDALDDVLSLGERAAGFDRDTPLLGSIPELDSMAVATLITTLEERLGIVVDDDLDGNAFATVGTLADYVSERLRG